MPPDSASIGILGWDIIIVNDWLPLTSEWMA